MTSPERPVFSSHYASRVHQMRGDARSIRIITIIGAGYDEYDALKRLL